MDRPFRFPWARRALVAAAALLVFASPAAAEDAAPPFLRFDDTRLGVAIVRGREQSPTFRALLDQNPQMFPPLYRTRNVTLYATSGRMRTWMREHR